MKGILANSLPMQNPPIPPQDKNKHRALMEGKPQEEDLVVLFYPSGDILSSVSLGRKLETAKKKNPLAERRGGLSPKVQPIPNPRVLRGISAQLAAYWGNFPWHKGTELCRVIPPRLFVPEGQQRVVDTPLSRSSCSFWA